MRTDTTALMSGTGKHRALVGTHGGKQNQSVSSMKSSLHMQQPASGLGAGARLLFDTQGRSHCRANTDAIHTGDCLFRDTQAPHRRHSSVDKRFQCFVRCCSSTNGGSSRLPASRNIHIRTIDGALLTRARRREAGLLGVLLCAIWYMHVSSSACGRAVSSAVARVGDQQIGSAHRRGPRYQTCPGGRNLNLRGASILPATWRAR